MDKAKHQGSVRVSVVVPVYNGERFIAECVESVLEQSLRDLELLVVDDGSTDTSAEIARRYVHGDSRVQLLRHPGAQNRGVSRSRELAVTAARGNYVALLDADDVFEPGKLERQVEELDRRPHCVLCHTGIHQTRDADVDAGGLRGLGNDLYDRLTERNYRLQRSTIDEYRLLDRPDALQRNWICNSSVMVRAEALRGLRFGFPQLYQVEDWALWIRLALRGPFLLLPEPLVRWRRHHGQATSTTGRDRLKSAYARLEFLLYLLSSVDDEAVQRRAEEALSEALQDVAGCYAEGSGGESAWEPGEIALARLSPGQHRNRRWRGQVAKWARGLFAR